MSNQDSLIEQFTSITGCEAERARFYLEAANWDVDLAVTQFFDNDTEDADMDVAEAVAASVHHQEGQPARQDSESPEIVAEGPPRRPQAPVPVEKPKFATLFSSGKAGAAAAAGSDSDDSSDEETRQRYFVGGSEKSGQEVLAPRKPKDLVDNLFAKAKEHGGEEVDLREEEAMARGGAGGPKRMAFVGRGHRLGHGGEPAAGESSGASSGSTGTSSAMQKKREPVKVVLRMWQQGLTIDDEPLMLFDNPDTQRIMDSLKRGILPPEITAKHPGKLVNLDMENRVHEPYVPPKPSVKAFTGAGHKLDSSTGSASSGASSVNQLLAQPTATATASSGVTEAKTDVDPNKPQTTIQVRLGDGTRLIVKLNQDATISRIREAIIQERPDMSARKFVLLTAFPTKELADEAQTLLEANVLNSVINQRFK